MVLRALSCTLPLVRGIRCLHIARNHTAVSADLFFFALDILLWSVRSNGFFVAEDEQGCVAGEVPVEIFEGSACGFGVEEVDFVNVRTVVGGGEVHLPIGMKAKLKTHQMM